MSPRCGTRTDTLLPRRSAKSCSNVATSGGSAGTRISRGMVSGSPAYSWSRKSSTSSGVPPSSTRSATQPRWPRIRPPADVEDLHRHLERVLGQRDHVGVGAVAEDDRLLLQRLPHRAEVVAEPGGLLVVLRLGGGVHLLLDPLHERRRLAAHEVAEVVDDPAVVLGADRADAGRRALVDVAEQARPPDLRGPLEDAVGARPHREHPQQQVDGLADRPGVAVGPEVAGALLLGTPADHHPRELVADRDREPGVGLVVAVLDVEPRVELLDPGVLQLERLDLGRDDGPLDAGGGRHHRGGALVQVADVLEVRREPGPEVLGLADVDDPALGVAEPVDAGLGRDRPGLGPVGQRPPGGRVGRAAGTLQPYGPAGTPAGDSPGDPANSLSGVLLYLHALSRPLRLRPHHRRRGRRRLHARRRATCSGSGPAPWSPSPGRSPTTRRSRSGTRRWRCSATSCAPRSTSAPGSRTPSGTPPGGTERERSHVHAVVSHVRGDSRPLVDHLARYPRDALLLSDGRARRSRSPA